MFVVLLSALVLILLKVLLWPVLFLMTSLMTILLDNPLVSLYVSNLDDCRRVFATSSGQVTMQPKVPLILRS